MSNNESSIVNIHTPSTSFAIPHSISQESLVQLFDKLSRKQGVGVDGARVGPGWLKYEWNGTVWTLDDSSDYQIMVWRFKEQPSKSPTLHMQSPSQPLPAPPAYTNPEFYLFRPSSPTSTALSPPRPKSRANSTRSGRSKKSAAMTLDEKLAGGMEQRRQDFLKFQSESGVRTLIGNIGPVNNVRMLLKSGYRNVYVSRSFAGKHGFIPKNAKPGLYGYGGLVNIGQWPVTIGKTTTTHHVYLSEELHFDVILGRTFMERRGIKLDPTDLTNIVCMDTGEKVDCELVVLRDGKGDFVTVT